MQVPLAEQLVKLMELGGRLVFRIANAGAERLKAGRFFEVVADFYMTVTGAPDLS